MDEVKWNEIKSSDEFDSWSSREAEGPKLVGHNECLKGQPKTKLPRLQKKLRGGGTLKDKATIPLHSGKMFCT